MVAFHVALYAALAVSSPFWIFFMGGFILPALNLKERSVIFSWLGWSVLLFLAGVLSTYFVLLPVALRASVKYSELLGFSAQDWRATEYIGFVCRFIFGMGLGFQFPLVVLFLVKIGILTHAHLAKYRRHVVVLSLILGALLTTPEVVTQVAMAVPLYLLYEICIWIAWYWSARSAGPAAIPRSERPRGTPAPLPLLAFDHALLLLLLIAGLSVIARWLPWPELITYLAGGVAAAYCPGFPRFTLDPGFFFLCFLPPLLFADGWLIPLRELFKAKRPIVLLAVGLVLFTTVTVGLVTHALVPGLPLAMAFALGAIISPTDAVSVNAVTERLRVPARVTTILNGESLLNDATGLVAFKFALAAVIAGSFSIREMAFEFPVLSLGGFGIGFAVGYGIGRLRDLLQRLRSSDALIEDHALPHDALCAYLLADSLGVSGVLAVVASGLYSGWRDPVRMDAETRRSSAGVWALLIFWMNGIAFVLLGLEFPEVLAAVSSRFSIPYLLGLTGAVAGTAMVARIVWVYPGAYIPFLFPGVRRREARPSPKSVFVVSWAGMRGTVTLAAALSHPARARLGPAVPQPRPRHLPGIRRHRDDAPRPGHLARGRDPKARTARGRGPAQGGAPCPHDGGRGGPARASQAGARGGDPGPQRRVGPGRRRVRAATLGPDRRGGDAAQRPPAPHGRPPLPPRRAGRRTPCAERPVAQRRHHRRGAPAAHAAPRLRGVDAPCGRARHEGVA